MCVYFAITLDDACHALGDVVTASVNALRLFT